MFNLKNLFTRALLALMLLTGAGAALAGPTYHVTIDSTGYSGTGLLDFQFSTYVPSDDTAVFLSNFTGDYTDASGLAAGVLVGATDGFGYFAQTLNLGGRFGFDARFDSGAMSEGVALSVGLFSDELEQWLGTSGTIALIQLTPGEPSFVEVDTGFASASEVPEPATLASIMLGLTLMGSTLRARRKK
ncbi:NF038129 family PEP-CTERM protein [Massilia suwonensis]|uniref:NF038129 family PEP-CTERM protein n=1 Tax=Massilia suwonensis TaxID=648895 RepID=A0ABW0MST7_9BURK